MKKETRDTAGKHGGVKTPPASQDAPQEEPCSRDTGSLNSGQSGSILEGIDRTKWNVLSVEEPIEIPSVTPPAGEEKPPGERFTDWTTQLLKEQDEKLRRDWEQNGKKDQS